MANYTISGNGHTGTYIGEDNFKSAARALLTDKGFKTADFFKLKTVEDYIAALVEKGFSFNVVRNKYDKAADENPHLAKYLREIEEEENERISDSAQITKVTIKKDEQTAQVLYNRTGSKSSKEVTFKGHEEVINDFLVAFRGMSKFIIQTLGFPEEWMNRLTTTGISITWKESKIMGMVITAQLAIDGLNSPFNLNTPFMQVESYHNKSDSCEEVYFDYECEEQLEQIIGFARKYMAGETGATCIQQALPMEM